MNSKVSEYDKELRKEHRTNLKAYAGFLSAIVFAILSKTNVENSWVVLTLLSISITSSVGSLNIEGLTEYGKENNSRNLLLFSMTIIYIPSIIAISILIGTASVIAGTAFMASSVSWFIFIIKLRGDRA